MVRVPENTGAADRKRRRRRKKHRRPRGRTVALTLWYRERYGFTMNAAEIILLMLGFLSVSISFFVGKQGKDQVEEERSEDGFSRDLWTDKEEEMIREQITRILSEEKNDIVVETTNILNRRSNEKIMEFDEFSSQVMAKISHNHDEVVFMYNLLSEKEKEWKEAAAKRPVADKEPVPETAAPEPEAQKTYTAATPVPEAPASPAAVPDKQEVRTVGKTQVTGLEQLARRTKDGAKGAQAVPGQIAAADSGQMELDGAAQSVQAVTETADNLPSGGAGSLNDQIIKLHKQGKSVVEISRELNVGQGEVKLTIALYGGSR